MTTGEVRDAAERVRRCLADGPDAAYPEATGGEFHEDCLTLAEAWLVANPADSDLPPTPERLRAAGWVQSENPDYLNYGEVPSGRVSICCRHPSRDEFRWALWNEKNGDTILLPPLPTMTAVRAWMKAVDAANAEGGAG